MRLHIHVVVVMGDQKLQDYLCGRKSTNSGNVGRVHQACMLSAAQASNTENHAGCRLVDVDVINKLNKLALTPVDLSVPGPAKTVSDTLPRDTVSERKEHKKALDFVKRTAKLAKTILGRVYSMHALKNAFDGIPFGANRQGILVATTDDHMHSAEVGIMLNVAQVSYHGLTESELNDIEQIIQSKVRACRSSVLSDYPRGMMKNNFGNLTLCSNKEKVGILYYLLLALHDRRGREVFDGALDRQQKKYTSFPS